MACPLCRRPADPAYRPFCGKRCADVDLARWLRGDYAIPGPPADDSPPDADEASPTRGLDTPPRRP